MSLTSRGLNTDAAGERRNSFVSCFSCLDVDVSTCIFLFWLFPIAGNPVFLATPVRHGRGYGGLRGWVVGRARGGGRCLDDGGERTEAAGEQEVRGRTEKVCGREGTRGKVGCGFEWASRGSKPGSGGGQSSAATGGSIGCRAAAKGRPAEGLVTR